MYIMFNNTFVILQNNKDKYKHYYYDFRIFSLMTIKKRIVFVNVKLKT